MSGAQRKADELCESIGMLWETKVNPETNKQVYMGYIPRKPSNASYRIVKVRSLNYQNNWRTGWRLQRYTRYTSESPTRWEYVALFGTLKGAKEHAQVMEDNYGND